MFLLKRLILLAKPFKRYFPSAAALYRAGKWMQEGASQMLITNAPKPIWLVEIVSKENSSSGVEINPNFMSAFQLFFQNGYEAFHADYDMRPISMKKVDLLSKGELKVSTYNFLFCESRKA